MVENVNDAMHNVVFLRRRPSMLANADRIGSQEKKGDDSYKDMFGLISFKSYESSLIFNIVVVTCAMGAASLVVASAIRSALSVFIG